MKRHADTAPWATPLAAAPSAIDGRLAVLVAERATEEGATDALFSGLRFFRASTTRTAEPVHYFGPKLIVVTQGRKAVRFGEREIRYDALRYLVITGEVSCEGAILEASPGRPFLGMSLDLPPELITKTLFSLADAGAEPPAEDVPGFVSDLDAPVRDGLIRLLRAVDDPLERRIVAPLVLEELVFRLLGSPAASVLRSVVGRGQDASAMQEAMRFMREHQSRSLSVEDVARHVAMSPSHFAHRFRAVARVSPIQYLKQLRLEGARTLMLSAGVRVGEAARRVGYESPSHFSRDFKSYFGASPAEHLRRLRA